ncbi:hypothetical protein HYFRA_00001346 [Hymenoscyphus fraxineus]|uniref:Cyclin-D1-binding protein 1-like N-terminal domain-containing protein n=1 Tax=Hymenoscyphus fraxineus TaxID=746836 RepID=A0A9N9L7E4_9HELO|nr:hypothetical protein HYFRA_00001346 [Hymenoscyphus fraxineus]
MPESEGAKKADLSLDALKVTVSTTSDLIAQLVASTTTSTSSSYPSSETEKPVAKVTEEKEKSTDEVDALKLSFDSASLIRAHATKLSLLIINKPFTASAITTILRELVASPLPGLASAVELCSAEKYTSAASKELQYRANKVFTELGSLVKKIPLDGQVLSSDQKNGGGKGSLASTGLVWDACDAVLELKTLGVAGLMIKRAEEYRDLVKDALEELQEWGAEESDDGEDEESDVDDAEKDGIDNSAQDALDDMFASHRHIPSDDPEKVRPRLESTQKRLRLIVLMYDAVIKRRLKTLPAIPHPQLPPELMEKSGGDPGIVSCLDEVLAVFSAVPDITDELANAFYELDGVEIDKRMDECFFKAFTAAELLLKNWEGKEDAFTIWARKFQIAMKKGW